MNRNLRHFAFRLLSFGIAATGLAGCGAMHDELPDCPEGLYVRFVYDYNTVQTNGISANLFNDHVGHIQLYVFGEDGQLVASRTVSNSATASPLADYNFNIHFTPEEVPAGHSYRLQAIALNKDWEEALATEGAKYRITSSPAEHENNLVVSLDHAETHTITNDAGEPLYDVDASQPLDIFWHTLTVMPHAPVDSPVVPPLDRTPANFNPYPADDHRVVVESEKATYATVSLIRDTKHLTIGLHQTDPRYKTEISADKFDVTIEDANCSVDHANTVSNEHKLLYTPYASWTVRLNGDGTTDIENSNVPITRASSEDVQERQAHYNIMFNRLMLNDNNDAAENAMLKIREKETGKLIMNLNLPHYLSMGRDAYAMQNYSHQEYLDREHNYHLDLFLSGDRFIALEIHVLSWSKRIQNVDFSK